MPESLEFEYERCASCISDKCLFTIKTIACESLMNATLLERQVRRGDVDMDQGATDVVRYRDYIKHSLPTIARESMMGKMGCGWSQDHIVDMLADATSFYELHPPSFNI